MKDLRANHVAIIMDGNGRWAAEQGLPRSSGHEKGADVADEVVQAALERGIGHLTLFALSSENLNRPSDEVTQLLALLKNALEQYIERLHQQGVKLHVVGAREALPKDLIALIERAESVKPLPIRLHLNIAIAYGGQWDIGHAAKRLARDVAEHALSPAELTEDSVASYLALADQPPPDILIRTGRVMRISNFLLWQIAYTELFFPPILWPEFSGAVLDEILAEFEQRDRRFGLLNNTLGAA